MKLKTKVALLCLGSAIIVFAPVVTIIRKSTHTIVIEELASRGIFKATALAEKFSREWPLEESRMLPVLQEIQEQTGAVYVCVLDTTYRVLAHTVVTEKDQIYLDASTRDDFRQAVPRAHPVRYRDQDVMEISMLIQSRAASMTNEEFFLGAEETPETGQTLGLVRLAIPLESVLLVEKRLFRRIITILSAGSVVAMVVIIGMLRRFLRPIRTLSMGTTRISAGEYGVMVPVLSNDELGSLARDFNRMSGVLAETTISKDYLGSILSNMIDPLIVIGPDDTLRMVNQATLDLLGYAREELEGQRAPILFIAKAQLASLTDQETLIPKGSVRNLEVEFLKKSGEKVPVLFSSSVMKDNAGKLNGIIAVAKDMTERKRLESIIRQSDKMSAVGQLAAGVAHEINNPLGIILGFAQAALRRVKSGEVLEMPLKSIEKEALRCRDLVQDLLTFSRVSKIEREPLDLNRTIEGALSLASAQARIKNVEVHRHLAPDLPRLLGNSNQIQQVIVNLANNALDAMGGEGHLTVETRHLQEGPLSWIYLTVVDTGTGIAPEILSRIFDPFFTTKPVGQGTGLGLSLVHEIIKKHSGLVEVNSRPGLTEFRIKFPVRMTQTAASEKTS